LEEHQVTTYPFRKEIIIAFLVRVIKIYATMLAPFLPSLCAKVYFMLGCKTEALNGEYNRYGNLK
jgi:methionyl-tRNA synthetase